MIDTVAIYSTKFFVRSKNLLEIVSFNYDETKFDKPRYLFTYLESSEPCYAYEAKGEWKGFRIRIYPMYRDDIPLSSLSVSFEIATIFDGFNVNSISEKQVSQIKGKLEKALDQIGIAVDLETFKIKRLDLSKNILLDHQLKDYRFILNYLKPIRSGSSSLTDNSMYKGNKSYLINLYDKGEQLQNKFNIALNVQDGRTWARFEIRLLNSVNCKRVLTKVGLLNNISAFCSRQGWRKLKKVFNNEINQLFYLDMKVGTNDCQDDLLNAERLISEGETANSTAALITLSKHFDNGNFDQFVNVLNTKNKPRISQYRETMRQKIVKYNLSSASNAIKYREMKEKLLFDPELKSHRRKYTSAKTEILSIREDFLVTKPEYFIDKKRMPNKYDFVEIASLFFPEESVNENR